MLESPSIAENGKKEPILERIRKIKKDSITLIVLSSRDYAGACSALVEHLTDGLQLSGIYLTFNKPFEALKRIFDEAGINTGKLFFIDAISGPGSPKEAAGKSCINIPNPSALAEVGQAISRICSAKKAKFLVIDSLSAILLYHNENTAVRFLHQTSTKMRKSGIMCIIISSPKDLQGRYANLIAQFADQIIDLTGQTVSAEDLIRAGLLDEKELSQLRGKNG